MGQALPPGHVAALARVAAWLADARSDWWIIAGAAVALHGGWPIEVDDIDVLIGAADVPLVAALPGVRLLERGGSERFRSDFYAAIDVGGVTVEFMAGFRVRGEGGWEPVLPRSRLALGVGAVDRQRSREDSCRPGRDPGFCYLRIGVEAGPRIKSGVTGRGDPACTIYLLARAELIAMLRSFGRLKDLARVALLAG